MKAPIVDRIKVSSLLFADKIERRKLLGAKTIAFPIKKIINVEVIRNHAFESVCENITLFSRYFGLDYRFNIGPYDDTLSITNKLDVHDVILIYVSLKRYEQMDHGDFHEWFIGRLQKIRATSDRPILVCIDKNLDFSIINLKEIPGVNFYSIESITEKLNISLYDEEMANVFGTPINSKSFIYISRILGCSLLPAVVLPSKKAIIFDLDNTLHSGVLGEDGIEGVELTEGHQRIHKLIKQLNANGIFTCLVSKNDEDLVQKFFDNRDDLVIKWDDFIIKKISWDSKSESIKDILNFLRVGADTAIFVDDNTGEIASVEGAISNIDSIIAADPEVTANTISFYPGIFRFSIKKEDEKRSKDLLANVAREQKMTSYKSNDEYLSELKTTLTFSVDDLGQVSRIAELSNKTNQFNFSYQRLSESEIHKRIKSQNQSIVSIFLKDILSDSGNICFVSFELKQKTLIIDELCLSCRAMGRGLEEQIIFGALFKISKIWKFDHIYIDFSWNERNQPARNFLTKHTGVDIKVNQTIELPKTILNNFTFKSTIIVR